MQHSAELAELLQKCWKLRSWATNIKIHHKFIIINCDTYLMHINGVYKIEENTRVNLRIIVTKIYLLYIIQGVISLHWLLCSSLWTCERQSKKFCCRHSFLHSLHCGIFSALGRKSDICIHRERKKVTIQYIKIWKEEMSYFKKKGKLCMLGFSL